jgi:hypothetical protein
MQKDPEIEISEGENDAEFPGEVVKAGGCLFWRHFGEDSW